MNLMVYHLVIILTVLHYYILFYELLQFYGHSAIIETKYRSEVVSFEAQLIPAKKLSPEYGEAVGVFIPGIDANIQNTGNRIQEMADDVGMHFLMTDVLPQGKPTVDEMDGMTTREVNQPSGEVFQTASRRRVDFVRDSLRRAGLHQDNILLMGDSLGVPLAQGMQLHADETDRFDTVLLRDGWNLGRSESAGLGRLKYVDYQLGNIVRDLGRKITGKGLVVPDRGWEKQEDWPREYGMVGMVKDVTDLMRSFETRRNAVELAGRAAIEGFGFNVVCLQSGLSGTHHEQDAFLAEVQSAYEQKSRKASPNTLLARRVPGWHSDLLDPARGADDVRNTLDLLA
jgi:hypothetical protein